ncbi:hypothetical protein PMAC_003276 [Pneumocystis sp. 'macacae']|nr:hypothetical protein PMAC_003276 [Pneumocystis sp. 'macacae']
MSTDKLSEKVFLDPFNSFKDKLKLKGCRFNNINANYEKKYILSLKMITIKKVAEFSNQLTIDILKLIPWNNVGEYLWEEITKMNYDSFKLWKIFVTVYFSSIKTPDVFNRSEILMSSFVSILKEIDCVSLSWLNTLDINNNKTLSTKDFIYISYLHNLVALNVSNTNLTDIILSHWGRAAQKGKFLQLLYIDMRNNKCSLSYSIPYMVKFKSLLYFSIEDYQPQKVDFLYKKYSHLKPSNELIESIIECNTFEESYKCIFNFHSHFAKHSILYNLFIKSQNNISMKQNPPLLFYIRNFKDSAPSLGTNLKKNASNISKISILEKKNIYKKIKSRLDENWKDIIG